jgi:hypothetical protein
MTGGHCELRPSRRLRNHVACGEFKKNNSSTRLCGYSIDTYRASEPLILSPLDEAMFWPKCACSFASIVVLAGTFLVLNACDDGSGNSSSTTQTFTVGGSVSGLDSGDKVVLLNNGSDALTMSANSGFTFSSPVNANGAYSVIVETQPTGEVCTVSKGGGAGVTANISGVAVACSTDKYSISGSVSGLGAGAKVVLENNGTDSLTIAADGVFKFPTPAAYNGSYAVTVATQPAGATCSVTKGVGAGITGSISNVMVNCSSNTVAIGGRISGLTAGQQVTLDDNGADPLTLTANGVFTFSTQVADQGSYSVTVGTQPVAQTCTVVGGGGNHVTSPVSNVAVTCSTDNYTVGGAVVGLAGGTQVTLDNNGADALTLTGNGTFTFSTPVAYDGAYAVTVGTQPPGQTCTVSNASNTLVTANVTNIGINCVSSAPVSFTTPGSYTWTVPTGATSIQVLATGGGGGGGGAYQGTPSGAGGAGAILTSTLSVTAGQVLNLVVGGGGGSGASAGQYCTPGGGGGGSTNVDAGTTTQIIAGGGGGGGGLGNGCGTSSAGGDAGGPSGAGGNSGGPYGGGGGSGGVGGAGYGGTGNGGSGNGGAGGSGGNNGPQLPGGTGGSGIGAGAGASNSNSNALDGGGGGGYGGGGYGGTGGGAGGSTGPAGTTYAPVSNGGAPGASGGDGSIVITPQ